MNAAVDPMMGLLAKIGFTTTGHTGEDVVLSIFDPNGNRPAGVMENTEIDPYIERSVGLDLKATMRNIFVDANASYKEKTPKFLRMPLRILQISDWW